MINPVLVIEVPLNRLTDAGLKGLFWLPTELFANLSRVNRVTLVMAGPIFNESDLLAIRLAILAGFQFV